jgi:hypothetical protein
MSDRVRLCIVLAHGRQELLNQCLEAIWPQVDDILVLDNASDPKLTTPEELDDVRLQYIPDQPPNISRFWNQGLDFFADIYESEDWDVALLCDDALPPSGWFDAVTSAMRATGAAIGCSNPWGAFHDPILKTRPDSDIVHRMPGWAWIMDGSKKIRARESMAWWWCDTDVDFQSRALGGMVMIGGYGVPNQRPNEFTNSKPELGARTALDAAAFAEFWGFRPW